MFCQYFLLVCGFSFFLHLAVYFAKQFLILMKSNLIFYELYCHVTFKKSFLKSQRFSPVFTSRCIRVLGFMLRPMIYFGLNIVELRYRLRLISLHEKV